MLPIRTSIVTVEKEKKCRSALIMTDRVHDLRSKDRSGI